MNFATGRQLVSDRLLGVLTSTGWRTNGYLRNPGSSAHSICWRLMGSEMMYPTLPGL
jgi:hypothetical protein